MKTKASLVVWNDGQGDSGLYVITPELYTEMQNTEVHQSCGLLYMDGELHPGVLKRIYCQDGVFEDADLSEYEIFGVLVDTTCW